MTASIVNSVGSARHELLPVTVAGVRHAACDVVELELVSETGDELPHFEPGAHIDVHLPNGLVRQYSLSNYGKFSGAYRIGVARAEISRGGSSHIHTEIQAGSRLLIGAPRNNFPLVPDASRYLFVAGGIGITPIMSMIRWCDLNKKPWRLLYCVRSRSRAAFWSEISELSFSELTLHCDEECGGDRADIKSLIASVKAGENIYCCGPAGLMRAVENAARSFPADAVHFEWFSRAEEDAQSKPGDQQFDVVLRQSGKTISVSAEKTILEALEDADVMAPFGCREGLCGSCVTTVCGGEPDHRDQVLTEAERKSGKVMMICVSRAKGDRIELDL
ncbi:PDR/VanB family oxidoreductase [Cupriavidus basilensis]